MNKGEYTTWQLVAIFGSGFLFASLGLAFLVGKALGWY